MLHHRKPLVFFSKGLLVVEVGFVANEHQGDFIVGVVLGFVQPFVDVLEGLPAGDVVDEDDANGAPVVGPGDGLEGLLSCLNNRLNYSVPNLQFYLLSTCLDQFGAELHSNCGVMIELELLLQELEQDA